MSAPVESLESASPGARREVGLAVAERLEHFEAVREDVLAIAPPDLHPEIDARYAAARVAFDQLLAELKGPSGSHS